MKILVFTFLLSPVMVFGQETFTFAPASPQPGDEIRIVYNPEAETAVLKNAEKITAYTLHWPVEGDPVFHEYTMTRSGDVFKAVIENIPHDVTYIQTAFRSGELIDDDNGAFWNILFHDETGNVRAESYQTLGRSYLFSPSPTARAAGTEMLRDRDWRAAASNYAKAYSLNPDDKDIALLHLRYLGSVYREAEDKEALRKEYGEIIERLQKVKTDPAVKAALIISHSAFVDHEEAQRMSETFLEEYDTDPAAIPFRSAEIYDHEIDDSTRYERAMAFLDDFPDSPQASSIINVGLIQTAGALDKYDVVFNWLEAYDYTYIISLYNNLANFILANEHDPQKALKVSKRAIELSGQRQPERPSYVSLKAWNDYIENLFPGPAGRTSYVYAEALMANEMQDEAVAAAANARKASRGENLTHNTRYMEYLVLAEQHDKAVKIGRESIVNNSASEDLLKNLEKAYLKVHGPEDFDQFMAEARAEAAVHLRAEYTEALLNEEAPGFTLVRLDEGEISLDDLENKVVVLDFWATWCGPCISAFPHFQQVVDHFEDNPDVKFLAINTWEGDLDEERYEKVNTFITDNEYTFTVLMDEDEVVSEYGVQGIPTRITLGRDGKVRFRDVGFSPGMAQSMIVQIEMLLEETQGQGQP